MELNLKWLSPFMFSVSQQGLIYDVPRLKAVPESPGIYIFVRVHGDSISPLYIGKALSLRGRIEQQLNNLKLMRAIETSPAGHRQLHVAEFCCKTGQKVSKAIAIIESAFISTALVEGFELINKKGTKTLVHTISSNGNREARLWFPAGTIKLRRA